MDVPSPARTRRYPLSGRTLLLLVATLGLLLVAPPVRAIQPDQEDLIVTEVGSGLVETDTPECRPDAGGQARAFRSELGLLCILRTPPLSADEIALLVAVFEDPTAEAFAVGSIEPSSGVAFSPAPDPAYAVSFGAGPYLYTIFLIRSSVPARFDDRAFLIDLAEQHVALVASGGMEPIPETTTPPSTQSEGIASPEVPRGGILAPIDPQLSSLLVDIAPFRRVASPIADIHLVNSELSTLGDVGQALSEGTTSLVQLYEAPGALIVGVLIAEYRYPLFAAAVLGNAEALDVDPDAGLGSAHDRDGMVALGGAGRGPIGAAFRQGRTVYVVTTVDDIPVDLDEAADAVGAIAAAHYDAGPQGATSAFVFPSTAAAAAQTLFLVGTLGAGVGIARTMSGRPARRIRRRNSSPATVVDMTDAAAAERWRGRFLFAVQLLCVAALVIGLTVLDDAVAVAIVVAALFIATSATRAARNMDMPPGLRQAMPRPGLAGLAIGTIALALLAAGTTLTVRRARVTLFRPTLDHLELAGRIGVEPDLLGYTTAGLGVGLLVAGASVFRLARRRGRATAERLRQADPRAEILYLRSFDDDILPIRSTFSARRPFLESFSLRGREPFEEAIAWQIGGYGPVIAVGQPDRPLASLGAAREHLAADRWRGNVERLMGTSQAILVVVGRTEGLGWEIAQIVRNGHLDKAIFVSPPLPGPELGERWNSVLEIMDDAGVPGALPSDASQTIATRFDPAGTATVFTARRRDEASYRVSVDAAIAPLASV